MASPKIVVKDRGYRALLTRIQADQSTVKIGVYGEKGQAKEAETDKTVAEIAEIHEFGRGNNPERSWLRNYVLENEERIKAMIRRMARAVREGKMTQEEALNLFGLQVVGEIKARITKGIAPALAASTLRIKGADKSTPLIRHGQFIGSIDHTIVKVGS
jgi:hypothetical protein